MMTLQEWKRLNPQDPASWPLIPKLLLLFVGLLGIVGAGFYFLWNDQLTALDKAEKKESALKQTYMDKKTQAVNLDAYRQQLKDIEQAFGALLKQLPDKKGMEALLIDINQAGLGRGLQFDLFKPAPSESVSEFYAELPISIRVTGGYHDMGAFASDVAQLPRIVTLSDINIVQGKDSLSMEATARTYRYLDPDEVSAQKKATKAAKDAKDTKGAKKK